MHNVKFTCTRITTEAVGEAFGSRSGAPCLKVCAQGVFDASLLEVVQQFDPKDIVRLLGARVLLEYIEEGEAKKHYGWN